MSVDSISGRARSAHAGPRFHFVRHLVEMFLAMGAGMVVGPLLLAVALGMSIDQARLQHAVVFVLVMAVSMTVPMVAWMRHRGHPWRGSAEMAVAMVAPALPLICLKTGHVISGQICSSYCLWSTVAMVALIVYRRSDYRLAAAAHT